MKRSFNTRGLVVAAASIVAATALLRPAPSQAQWNSWLRLYEHTGFNGYYINTSVSESELRWSRGFNDLTSSVENLSGVAWVLYDDTNYSDRRYCIKPGQRISNLHSDAWKFGDKISSVKRLGTSSCSGYPTF